MNKESKALFQRVGQRIIGREAYNATLNAGEDKSEAKMNSSLQIFTPFAKNGIDHLIPNSYPTRLDILKFMMEFATDIAVDFGPAFAAIGLHAPALAYPIVILGSKLVYNSGLAFLEEKSKK